LIETVRSIDGNYGLLMERIESIDRNCTVYLWKECSLLIETVRSIDGNCTVS
jgi:hypothetical protein